jgi:hypothetical protein
MPYKVKGQCVYKKDGGAKVGCTKGDVDKYLAALHANIDESKQNKLVGGKADKLTPADIAKKFDVTLSKIQNQIRKGIKIESEHTSDKRKATEIATDHVSEFPDYYDRLKKMEIKASKETKIKDMNENTKSLIKRLLREELEEGKLGRMAGTLGMAAASMMPGQMNANPDREPIEYSKDEETKLGVTRNLDGSFTSTAITDGPNAELALKLAIDKAKNQVLKALDLDSDSGRVVKVSSLKKKLTKDDSGKILCKVTITATVE